MHNYSSLTTMLHCLTVTSVKSLASCIGHLGRWNCRRYSFTEP